MEPAGNGGEVAQLKKERRDSIDDNAEDCPVCLTAFDDTLWRPRTLPCGHTFCTPCINELKDQGEVICPACRVAHVVPETGQFPVSYTIEAFIRRMRGAALTSPSKPGMETGEPAPSPVTGPGQNGPEGLSRPIRSMLQEQEAKVLAAIRTCQEVQAQLDQYQTTLAGWGEQQQNLEDRLQALLDQSKDARVLLRQEECKLATKKEQFQQGEQRLHALLQTLRSVATRQEAWEVVDDADHCTDEEGQRAEECQRMFPDLYTVTTINKVAEVSNAALEAAMTVQAAQENACGPSGDTGDTRLFTAEDSSITDKVESLLSPTLKIKDLRNLTQKARRQLQAGIVFAIHQQEGQSRHARITLEDGRLYLHSLQDQPLLPSAITVQIDEVVPAAPPCLVFLDLAWPGSSSRRVFIRLSSNTPRGRQFLLLCTGQRGPTYANTTLFKVFSDGWGGEWVVGGDYENNNGRGGAALLPNLAVGEYRESRRAGAVCGWWDNNPATSAMFRITTKKPQNGFFSRVFGDVVGGLEVVVAAAKHNPITEVTVMDCGVVLWE